MNQFNPTIYVACLESYNNGILYGARINALQSPRDIMSQVSLMLKNSSFPHAEEWEIHDYDDFGGLTMPEHVSVETVTEIAHFIHEQGELGVALLKYFGLDLPYVKEAIEEHYLGEYDSEADFVESFTEDTNPVPEHLSFYIDYEKMARDYFINDFFSVEVDYKAHVFFRF